MNFNSLLWMSSTMYAVSLDCPDLLQLADKLGMQSKQPTIWNALNNDCCSADGVTCDQSERVTEIRWGSMQLNGTINGTAISSSVTWLGLNSNSITGPIPIALPSGLITLILDGNRMSGDLPSFPSNVRKLWLGYPGNPGNHFTGTLLLNQPLRLYINHNLITDVVIQNSSDFTLCDLSNNPLLGNPTIANLTMCTKNGLYSAALLSATRNLMTTAVRTDEAESFLSASASIGSTTSAANIIITAMIPSDLSTVALGYSFVPLNPIWTLLEWIKMILKVVVDMILMIWFIYKTPWKRALRSKINKIMGKGAGNMLLTA